MSGPLSSTLKEKELKMRSGLRSSKVSQAVSLALHVAW